VIDTPTTSPAAELCTDIRAVRARYDKLSRGEVASLRRCRTADEVSIEGTYWRVGSSLAQRQSHLPHVVLLFPLAQQVAKEKFLLGRLLRNKLGDSAGAALRVRRLLDSRDRDDLDHRLRGILRLACADRTPVDWGVLGTDILWFFAESGAVRRRWAQDFYAPTTSRPAESFATQRLTKDRP
jgi:CRISPR type I-E-associated protein CasB/Cse2